MAEYDTSQALIGWEGSVASLILEMKRRANVTTDTQLADVLGLNQSTVSTWRRRGSVPEAVLLRFAAAANDYEHRVSGWRYIAARAIALRVATFMDEQKSGTKESSWSTYQTVSMGFNSLVDAIYADLISVKELSEVTTFGLAERFINDESYLAKFASWMRDLPIDVAFEREVGRMIVRPAWHPAAEVPQ